MFICSFSQPMSFSLEDWGRCSLKLSLKCVLTAAIVLLEFGGGVCVLSGTLCFNKCLSISFQSLCCAHSYIFFTFGYKSFENKIFSLFVSWKNFLPLHLCFLYFFRLGSWIFFRFGLLNVSFYAVYDMDILPFSFNYDG